MRAQQMISKPPGTMPHTDRQAPFGGIIVVNNTLDLGLASKISEIFCEVIIAPGFTDDAREIFAKKKNLRLLVSKAGFGAETLQEIRSVPGGYLAQDRDQKKINPKAFEVVTKRQPTEQEWRSMLWLRCQTCKTCHRL